MEMAKQKGSVCQTPTAVLTRLCWCGAYHRELPRMGCGQGMERKNEKEMFWDDVGCPRAFLIRKATMGTQFWQFSYRTVIDCGSSSTGGIVTRMSLNWQIRVFDLNPW